jgi:hypothetical protein
MSINVVITENEILNNPSDIELGGIVRRKYFKMLENNNKDVDNTTYNKSNIHVDKVIKKTKDINSWEQF